MRGLWQRGLDNGWATVKDFLADGRNTGLKQRETTRKRGFEPRKTRNTRKKRRGEGWKVRAWERGNVGRVEGDFNREIRQIRGRGGSRLEQKLTKRTE